MQFFDVITYKVLRDLYSESHVLQAAASHYLWQDFAYFNTTIKEYILFQYTFNNSDSLIITY